MTEGVPWASEGSWPHGGGFGTEAPAERSVGTAAHTVDWRGGRLEVTGADTESESTIETDAMHIGGGGGGDERL